MKFSLIMATLGRRDEVESFIKSLQCQKYTNYELIIVDQNEDAMLADIVEKFKNYMEIKHVRIEKKGLSLARNIGLQYANGDIIAFPDDDCEYPLELLKKIFTRFKRNKLDIVSCKSIDKKTGAPNLIRWKKNEANISIRNLFQIGISFTLFFSKDCLSDHFFDERLGVGKYFGSAEESDFLFRLLLKGCTGRYIMDTAVYHPSGSVDFNNREMIEKKKKYSLGKGAFYRKHLKRVFIIPFLFLFINYMIIRPFGALSISIFHGMRKTQYFYSQLKYMWFGFFSFKHEMVENK